MKSCLLLVALAAASESSSLAVEDIKADALDRTQVIIGRDKPTIADAVLVQDRNVVNAVYPEVLKKYGERLSKEEIQASLLWQWRNLRTGKHPLGEKEALEMKTFMKVVLAQGVVAITSDPSGADLSIDGTAFNRTTETNALVGVGSHTIEGRKDGKTDSQSCDVTEGKVTPVSLQLK